MENFIMVHGFSMSDLGGIAKRNFKKGLQAVWKPTKKIMNSAKDFALDEIFKIPYVGGALEVVYDNGGEKALNNLIDARDRFIERKIGLKTSNPDLFNYIEKLWPKTDTVNDFSLRSQKQTLTKKEIEIRQLWNSQYLGTLDRDKFNFGYMILGVEINDIASIKTCIDNICIMLTSEKQIKTKEDIKTLSIYLWYLIVVQNWPARLEKQIELKEKAVKNLEKKPSNLILPIGLITLLMLGS